MTADGGSAGTLFERASGCFQRALAEDPSSDVYKKALEMTKKAPALHAELQKQLQASQPGGGASGGAAAAGGGAARGGGGRSASSTSSDMWWDVAGWVALSAIVVGVVALARSGPTPATK